MPSRGVGAAAPSTLARRRCWGRRRPRRARRGVARFPLLFRSGPGWGRGSLAFATASSRAALSAVRASGQRRGSAAVRRGRTHHSGGCPSLARELKRQPLEPTKLAAQPGSTVNHGRRHRRHGRRRPAARGPAEHDVRRRPAQAVESVVVRAAREGWKPARRHERFIKIVDGFHAST